MAISFPSNPTTNQTYTYGTMTWTYNGTIWVQNAPTGVLGVNVANSAPSGSQVGTLWWDSDSGDFSVFYNNTWAGLTAAGPADGSITTAKIVDGAVTAVKLAAGAAVPSQTGQSGKYLTTDGTNASWVTINTTPSANSIASSMIADGSITSSKIASNVSLTIDTVSVTGNISTSVPIKNNTGKPILNQTGSTLQIVQTVVTAASTVTAPNGTATAVTGFVANITPTTNTSKILITLNLNYSSSGTTYGGWFKRNGTDIGLGDAGSGQQRVSFGMALSSDSNQINSFVYNYLDSPATTSLVSYQLYVNNDNTNSLFINRSVNDSTNATGKRCISTITLTEFAG